MAKAENGAKHRKLPGNNILSGNRILHPWKKREISNSNEQTHKSARSPPTWKRWMASTSRAFSKDGSLRPFRLMKSEVKARFSIYLTDWHFNQLIFASAVFVFFTNLLPGITFASDLNALTGHNYGTIEVIFSTGLCGIIFSLYGCK